MHIRTATMADLAAITAVEAACFPAAEAATEADFEAVWRFTRTISGFWRMRTAPSSPLWTGW